MAVHRYLLRRNMFWREQMNKTFVLASNNEHKLREFREIFSTLGLDVISLKQAGVEVDPEENGTTFAENAMIKARAVYELCKLPTVSDDSGLCVDALNGEPGVYSARYGDQPDDAARRAYLFRNMNDMHGEERAAHFTSAIACILNDSTSFVVEGYCHGYIAEQEAGEGGFGYDCMFCPVEYGGKTFSEITPEEKNAISHRGRALEKFVQKIQEIQGEISK